MSAKPVPRFVVIGGALIVIERPKCMFVATRFVNELAELFRLVRPKAAHVTELSDVLPLLEIDMTAAVERGNKFVSVPM